VDAGATPAIYEIVATFLLTGGRTAEVLGLDLEDVSFDRRTIAFRNNKWRRLKNRTSARTAPLWPQLEELLRECAFGGRRPTSGLLFPSRRGGAAGGLITDLRKSLDAIGAGGMACGRDSHETLPDHLHGRSPPYAGPWGSCGRLDGLA
jgi:integrase